MWVVEQLVLRALELVPQAQQALALELFRSKEPQCWWLHNRMEPGCNKQHPCHTSAEHCTCCRHDVGNRTSCNHPSSRHSPRCTLNRSRRIHSHQSRNRCSHRPSRNRRPSHRQTGDDGNRNHRIRSRHNRSRHNLYCTRCSHHSLSTQHQNTCRPIEDTRHNRRTIERPLVRSSPFATPAQQSAESTTSGTLDTNLQSELGHQLFAMTTSQRRHHSNGAGPALPRPTRFPFSIAYVLAPF